MARGTTAPLAVRMRPTSLDEVVGQRHLLGPGSPLRRLAAPGAGASGQSVILWGPPGTGKTTLAQSIAHTSDRRFVELSAVTAGVKDVRQVMEDSLNQRDLFGQSTVLFLDEIHRFTKAQQDALLPGVEQGWVTLIAATTENPSFSVISPLLSRSLLLTLEPLEDADIAELVDRAIADPRGFDAQIVLEDDAKAQLIRLSSGDARRALTALEAAGAHALEAAAQDDVSTDAPGSAAQAGESTDASDAATQGGADAPVAVTAEALASAVDRALLRYDRQGDEHYDVISAFIKSVRGSDADAALHYLARMMEAGEDPRFIARRLVVHASEDVGLADPTALQAAVAAAQAVQLIGMPEARINLAQATIHLAIAPKSNAVITAIDAAISDVKAGRIGQVPAHLRDAHYGGAKDLGHGKGYAYPHDEPYGVAEQQYLPDVLADASYYTPTSLGAEAAVKERWERVRRIVRGR